MATGRDASSNEQPLTEDELRALDVDVLEAREAMSTLLVAPAPGFSPPLIGVIADGAEAPH